MGNLIGKKPNPMTSGTSKIWRDAGIWERPLPETKKRHLKRIKRYNKIFKRLRKKV